MNAYILYSKYIIFITLQKNQDHFLYNQNI